jgi:uncharacterized membrane protein YciS (DUF1049 family)
MALWRFIKVILAALILFVIVVFFISNSGPDAQSLAATISFKFKVQPFLNLESVDFPVGYLLIISFTLGMIFAAIIGGINAFSRSREIKMKNKTIRELEKEIDDLRESMAREKNVFPEVKLSEELNRLPDQPEIH